MFFLSLALGKVLGKSGWSLGEVWLDAQGNLVGNQFLSRLRLFADNGQEYGTSNYFEVDPFNGAETTIIINR